MIKVKSHIRKGKKVKAHLRSGRTDRISKDYLRGKKRKSMFDGFKNKKGLPKNPQEHVETVNPYDTGRDPQLLI